jgi:hypothetical protein
MSVAMAIDSDMAALLEHGAACVRVDQRGKRPLGLAWNTLATTMADVIGSWLDGGYNVGILLGHGNLIDLEYDDDAGAELFRMLEAADGTPLCEIETPCWSSQRGMHHLFRLADTIPACGWVKRSGLEFRLGGKPAQSVLPPSTHASGRPYRWLVSPQQCAPAIVTLADLGLDC